MLVTVIMVGEAVVSTGPVDVVDSEATPEDEAVTETATDSEPVGGEVVNTVVIVLVAVGRPETELGVWMKVVPDFVDEVGDLGMGGKIGTNLPPGPWT